MRRTALFLSFALAVSGVTAQTRSERHDFDVVKGLEVYNYVLRNLDSYYVDSIKPQELVKGSVEAMLYSLDPYSEYYDFEDQGDLKLMTKGQYAGIGAAIRLYPGRDHVVIEEPYEGMPAYRYGLRAGDAILGIDSESMQGKNTSYVSERLRGEPDTSFKIDVRRYGEGDTLTFEVVRQTITMPAVPYWGLYGDVGLIYLSSFTEGCSGEVRSLVAKLKKEGAKYLVLDLRGNGGGLLDEAVGVVSAFVPKGTAVAEVRGKTEQTKRVYKTTNAPVDLNIPVAVLVNGESASASEIVAGALQDLDRGVVVGDRTFGKGLVQSTVPLPYNGTLKFTTSKYYIPSGRCIQEIDYSHRENGVARHIPDSLTSVFHTAGGREVRDGGGIRPDVHCGFDTVPELVAYLENSVQLHDFVNRFCKEHESIGAVEDFEVTDFMFDEFCNFIRSSDFKFESRSVKALRDLVKLARREQLYERSKSELTELESKLSYNLESDLQLYKPIIKEFLGAYTVGRYFFARGSLQQAYKSDNGLELCMEVLRDRERYNNILKPVR